MAKRWLRAAGAAAMAGTMVLAGQGVADASRPPVPVHATTVHPVIAPAFMNPGLVHLTNTGGDALMLLRKKKSGVTALVHDLNQQDSSTGVPRLFERFAVVDLIDSHADVYVRLRAGTYYLVDAFADRYHAADVHTVSVAGAKRDANAPHARAITVHADTNALSAPHVAHAGRFFHLRNRNHRMQYLVFYRVKKGVTSAQLADFLAHPTFEKFVAVISMSISSLPAVTITSGGEDLYARYPKHAGKYLAMLTPVSARASGLRANRLALITLV